LQVLSAIDQVQQWDFITSGEHEQYQHVVHACRVTILLESAEADRLIGRRGSLARLEAVSGRKDKGVKLVRRHENEVTFMVETEYRVENESFTPRHTGNLIMSRLNALMIR
jgi:hypothetical protein